MVHEHLLRTAAAFDLTPPQGQALRLLDDPVPMGDLAQVMHCDASNITGIVDRLEARGFLERQVDALDRRVKRLVVTEAGHELLQRYEERLFATFPLLDRLSTSERADLSSLIRTMATA